MPVGTYHDGRPDHGPQPRLRGEIGLRQRDGDGGVEHDATALAVLGHVDARGPGRRRVLGGGLQLALACDVRIAASNAILGLPGVKEGLIPGLATWRLPHYVGLGRAKRYILSGENIPARDALAIGLVDYVVPLGQFNRRVEEITKQYAKVCSVGTLQSKLMVNQSFDLEYETFRKKYLERQEIAQSSDDHYEARRAYLQKRDPVFK